MHLIRHPVAKFNNWSRHGEHITPPGIKYQWIEGQKEKKVICQESRVGVHIFAREGCFRAHYVQRLDKLERRFIRETKSQSL